MPHVEFRRVGAPVVVVTPTQDRAGRRGLRSLGIGEADVRVQRGDQALRVVGVDGIEEIRGILIHGVHGRAARLAAAENPLLLSNGNLLPRLDEEVHDTHHVVRAACGPGRFGALRLDPDHLIHLGLVGEGRIGDSVLEAEPVAPDTDGTLRIALAVNAPAQLHCGFGVGQDVEQCVHRRVAVIGADLDQQVTLAQRGVQVVMAKGLHRSELDRLALAQSVAAVEEGRAHSDCQGETIRHERGSHDAVVRWRCGPRHLRWSAARREEAGSRGQRAEKVGELGTAGGGHVERDENCVLLGQSGNACLVMTMKGNRAGFRFRLDFDRRVGTRRTAAQDGRARRSCQARGGAVKKRPPGKRTRRAPFAAPPFLQGRGCLVSHGSPQGKDPGGKSCGAATIGFREPAPAHKARDRVRRPNQRRDCRQSHKCFVKGNLLDVRARATGETPFGQPLHRRRGSEVVARRARGGESSPDGPLRASEYSAAVRAGNGDGRIIQCGEDFLDQALGHSGSSAGSSSRRRSRKRGRPNGWSGGSAVQRRLQVARGGPARRSPRRSLTHVNSWGLSTGLRQRKPPFGDQIRAVEEGCHGLAAAYAHERVERNVIFTPRGRPVSGKRTPSIRYQAPVLRAEQVNQRSRESDIKQTLRFPNDLVSQRRLDAVAGAVHPEGGPDVLEVRHGRHPTGAGLRLSVERQWASES